MGQRRKGRTTFVPRIVFGAACAAGVVPVCAVACGNGPQMGETGAVTSSGHGGLGGMPSSSGFGGVALTGFGTVAASGFGGFGGHGGAGEDAPMPDGGGPTDAAFGVAEQGFLVPSTGPGLPPERSPRRRASGRGRARG
jgi:hypothetical protein